MAQFPITKTTSHDQPVGNLYATQDGSSNYLFPTWLITSSGVEIGTAASPLYVSPGTGASWAVTGPLTDAQLRASAVPVSLASAPLPTDAATATKQDSQTTHLATLAGAVSGTEVQVDVLTMPTVTIQDGGGAITVDGTVAVSGSVVVTNAGTFAVQAAQSGSWSITDISGTISLPTGAATAAKQPALGTAGTSSSDVITVQGIAGMTALKVDGSAVTQPVSIAAAVAVTDNSGSLTVDAPVGTPLFVRLSDGASAITTLPVSMASVPSHDVTNAGTFAVQVSSSALPTGAATAAKQPALGTAGTPSTDVISVQGVSGGAAIPASQSGSWTVTIDSSALPTGAATSAKQDTMISSLSAIDGHVDGIEGSLTSIDSKVTACNTGAVVVSSSALPTGASTAARQDTTNTHLATLAGAVSGAEVQVDVLTMPTVTVADGGGSLTVDGTVAVTDGSGSLTVDAPVGTPVFVRLSDGAAAITTLPVSLASVPSHDVTNAGTFAVQVSSSALPTGAATAAKQPALGTAGTASADVITVQGIASMTALKVDGSAVTQPVSGTFWQATQPVSIAAAVAVTDNSGSLTVDNNGTFAVQAAQSGTWTVGLSSGTNNIGDVDVLTQPARAATTDTITAKLATDAIQNGTTALTPKYAKISASSSGNNTVVAAVTSKKIRVLGWNLVGNGAVNAKWQDGAGGTDLTGLYYVAAAGGGICVPFNPVGWFETSSNTLLNLNLSGAVAVGGSLCYVEV